MFDEPLLSLSVSLFLFLFSRRLSPRLSRAHYDQPQILLIITAGIFDETPHLISDLFDP